jgi:hypothetical protein
MPSPTEFCALMPYSDIKPAGEEGLAVSLTWLDWPGLCR